jgi:hypothetical protein
MKNSVQIALRSLMACTCALAACPAAAAFEEANTPVAVRVLYCDSNPRIVVQFADASKNIWYPANAGDQSKAFLATALTAKTSAQQMYYLGVGDANALTSYCIGATARRVDVFGLQ